MLLAIDVGNTNMVFGLYDGDKLRGSFRISTNSERTSDELGMLIAQYYHFHDISLRGNDGGRDRVRSAAGDVHAHQRHPQVSVCAAGHRGPRCGYRH